jgi:hypothetical protein
MAQNPLPNLLTDFSKNTAGGRGVGVKNREKFADVLKIDVPLAEVHGRFISNFSCKNTNLDRKLHLLPSSSHILVTSFLVFCHLGALIFCTIFSIYKARWARQNEK